VGLSDKKETYDDFVIQKNPPQNLKVKDMTDVELGKRSEQERHITPHECNIRFTCGCGSIISRLDNYHVPRRHCFKCNREVAMEMVTFEEAK
jgi:hypothetical protein